MITNKTLISKGVSITLRIKGEWLPAQNGGDIKILPQKLERFNPVPRRIQSGPT